MENQIILDQSQILKLIESGKFRNAYLIYNRKSMDEPDSQKNSIKYQKTENSRFAASERIPLALVTLPGFCRDGIVSERHSGFKEDEELAFGDDKSVRYRIERPKFHRMVNWLSKKYFKGVIILCWDRASRNKGDAHVLRKLMKQGVDVRFTLARYDNTSSGELHMDIDGMFAEHHSRVTREKVTLTFQMNRNLGIWPHKAGVGYLNQGSMLHKPKDPVRAPLILRMAELAAQGWTLSDLERWAAEQGFTMPPVRRRRTEEEILAEEEDEIQLKIEKSCRLATANNIHKILTNRFYTGKMPNSNGAWVPSRCHDAIIPEDLFEKVQAQLRRKNKSRHYHKTLPLPFRGLVRCGSCARLYTPYLQKGNVYLGARCHRTCLNTSKNVSLAFVLSGVEVFIGKLAFSESDLGQLESALNRASFQREAEAAQEQQKAQERRIRKLREDLAYLMDNRLFLLRAGAFTPEALVAEETKVTDELAALEKPEPPPVAAGEVLGEVIKVSELIKSVAALYRNALLTEKEEIIKAIVSELRLSEKILVCSCIPALRPFSERFAPVGDPTGWLSEVAENAKTLQEGISSIGGALSVCKPRGPS